MPELPFSGKHKIYVVVMLVFFVLAIVFSLVRLQTAEGFFSVFMQRHGLAGVVIAYGQRFQPPHLLALGMSDPDSGTPMGITDRFRIASLSKPITAALVSEMSGKGIFSLHERLPELLPEMVLPEQFSKISVLDLLRHSGGWDWRLHFDPFFLSPAELRRHLGIESGTLAHCSQLALAPGMLRLQFEPSSRYGYSNTGYCWLQILIEKQAGKSYQQAVQEAFPETLTMSLDPAKVSVRHPRQADRYPALQPAISGAGGGWISDTESYFKFVSRLPAWESWPATLEPPPYASKTDSDYYGLGWRVWQKNGQPYALSHYGAIPGVFTVALLFPDTGLIALAFFNGRPKNPRQAFEEILQYFLKQNLK